MPSGLTLLTRNGIIGLRASGIVGSMPLRNGETLQITPKVGQVNFLRMMYRALGSAQPFERQFEEFVEYADSDQATIPHFAGRQIGVAAEEILRRGSTLHRVPRVRCGRIARGQLQPHQTALALARRQRQPVYARIRERSRDTPENRLVRAALTTATSLVPADEKRQLAVLRRRWGSRTTNRRLSNQDLAIVEERLASGWYGGPRAYYYSAVVVSLILLGVTGMGIDGETSLEGEAHLLDSADIFEKYLREVISEAYGALGFVVCKSGLTPKTLYLDGTFGLEPDIVVEKSGEVELLADAKYKTPDASDHYQMQTYIRELGSGKGVLLTPGGGSGSVRLDQRTTSDGLATVTAYLPLEDLTETEHFLTSILSYV